MGCALTKDNFNTDQFEMGDDCVFSIKWLDLNNNIIWDWEWSISTELSSISTIKVSEDINQKWVITTVDSIIIPKHSDKYITVWESWSCSDVEVTWSQDQVKINEALLLGKEVHLIDWSYNIDNCIELPDNSVFEISPWVRINNTAVKPMIINSWSNNIEIRWVWVLDHWWASAWSNHTIRLDWVYWLMIDWVKIEDAWHHWIQMTNCFDIKVSWTSVDGTGKANQDWVAIIFEDCGRVRVWNNFSKNCWYHAIQCRWNCQDVIIYDNSVDTVWLVNTAWAWVNVQVGCSNVKIRSNVMKNLSSAWVSVESCELISIYDNDIDETTNNAAVVINWSSSIKVYWNNSKWTEDVVKIEDSINVSVFNNTSESCRKHWVYVIWNTHWVMVYGNQFLWMAWWATWALVVESALARDIQWYNNYSEWSRYLARFYLWSDDIIYSANSGKVTIVPWAVRDDSWWTNINLFNNIPYL